MILIYAELIDQKIGQVYQKGVATKILQGMDRIRNEFDETQARRWPTELLQNARDLSAPGQPVRVCIELTEDTPRRRGSSRNTQMRLAVSVGSAYILLLVIYDEERGQTMELRPFRDIPEQIAAGVLRSANGRYELEVLQQGASAAEKPIPA